MTSFVLGNIAKFRLVGAFGKEAFPYYCCVFIVEELTWNDSGFTIFSRYRHGLSELFISLPVSSAFTVSHSGPIHRLEFALRTPIELFLLTFQLVRKSESHWAHGAFVHRWQHRIMSWFMVLKIPWVLGSKRASRKRTCKRDFITIESHMLIDSGFVIGTEVKKFTFVFFRVISLAWNFNSAHYFPALTSVKDCQFLSKVETADACERGNSPNEIWNVQLKNNGDKNSGAGIPFRILVRLPSVCIF